MKPTPAHNTKSKLASANSELSVALAYNAFKKSSSLKDRKKHIENAKRLEKERRLQLIHEVVNQWLSSDSPAISRSVLKTFLTSIKDLIHMMGYRFTTNLLFPTIIYANKFVKLTELIPDLKALFHLLLVSALITVKMWEDCGIDSLLVEEVVGVSRKQISLMERRFLAVLDYNLFLTPDHIDQFQHDHSCTPIKLAPTS